MLAESFDYLDLFLRCQAPHGRLYHATNASLVASNKRLIVHIGKSAHDELAIHAISHSSVARNAVTKVFDIIRSLDPRGKEASERSDERRKGCEDEDVKLYWLNRECPRNTSQLWQLIRSRLEDWVWCAGEACPYVCAKVVHRADEVRVSHQQIGQDGSNNDRADPCSNEALHSLFRRYLNQRRSPECNATDVCEDVVDNDQRHGEEEPDHPLEDVVHHEVSLENNKENSHMGPAQLAELKSVGTLLQGSDEEHEAL